MFSCGYSLEIVDIITQEGNTMRVFVTNGTELPVSMVKTLPIMASNLEEVNV